MTRDTLPEPIELQLHRVALQDDTRALVTGLRQLSREEHQQASRCRNEDEHRRYVLIRARLREIVGRYLDLSPRSVRFELDAGGRLVLDPHIADGVHFDCSFAGELALIAVAGAAVGIDITPMREIEDVIARADERFTAAEAAVLRRAAPADQAALYLRCHTLKVAALKASGRATDDLTHFSVALDRPRQQLGLPDLRRLDQPASIESLQARTALLTLLHLGPEPAWIGAVAVTAPDVSLRWKT